MKNRDWRRIFEIAERLQSCESPDAVVEAALAGLHNLVDCEGTEFVRLSIIRPNAEVVHDTADRQAVFESKRAAYEAHYMTHPCIRFDAPRAVATIGDFATNRQFRATGLYRDAFRHLDIRFQAVLAIGFEADGNIVGLSASRSDKEFRKAERERLALVGRQIAQAYWREKRRSEFARVPASWEELERSLTSGFIFMTPEGRIGIMTELAWEAIRAFFPRFRGVDHTLPDDLEKWYQSVVSSNCFPDRLPEPLASYMRDDLAGRLVVDAMPVCQQPFVVLAVRWLRDADLASRIHSLSPRQKQVLLCLAAGLTREEIGQRLNISWRTVKKHLEAIYRLLDVKNRADAAHTLAAYRGRADLSPHDR